MKRMVVIRPVSLNLYLTVMKGDEIEKTITVPISQNSGINAENMKLVREALNREGIGSCQAGTVIPDSKCMLRVMKREHDSVRDLREAFLRELDLPADGEGYVFDYKLISRDEDGYRFLCVITDKNLVTDYRALFIRYGLRLDYLIPESVAIGNLIRNAGLEDNSSIFMDYGEDRIVIRAYDGVCCVAEHEIEYEAGEAGDNIGDIKLTLDYYGEQDIAHSESTGIYVYGEGAGRKDILVDLRSSLDCSIYPVSSLFHGRVNGRDASLIFPAMGSICIEGRRV